MVLPSHVVPARPEHLRSVWTRYSRPHRLRFDGRQSLSRESMRRVCPKGMLDPTPRRVVKSQLRSPQTPLMQHCTCEAQIHEHIATDNWYRLPDPWTVLDYFNPDNNSPPSAATSHNATGPFSYTSSPGYNDTILSGDARNMSLTPAPAPSPSPSSTAIQFDTTQTRYHSSDGDFARYSDHSPRSPYVGLPEGRAANGSFQYQDYGNPMYAEPPEAEGRSGSYGA
ncbi:hypothetical protein EDD85DRAFT_496560 [Armillaria nabsnona]|nr:hypothetical protein EDD85DRAFT_496560 [Armillaria nabsnona]